MEGNQASVFILSGALLPLVGLLDFFLAVGFLGPLSSLVPPPFVDLLFRHFEVLFILLPHLLDALSGPHDVFLEF